MKERNGENNIRFFRCLTKQDVLTRGRRLGFEREKERRRVLFVCVTVSFDVSFA